MISKTKKILALGLSLSLMMPASLSRRVCAAQGSETDTGCSRALVDGIHDPCMVAKTKCLLACYDALTSNVDTLSAFCGELKVGETPSCFLGCNEEFQKCMDSDCSFLNNVVDLKAKGIMDKPLSFWEEWKVSNRFWMINYPTFHFWMIVAGGVATQVLGVMFAGPVGAVLAAPLGVAYVELFYAE